MNVRILCLVCSLLVVVPEIMAEVPIESPFRFVRRPTEPIALASYDVVDAVSDTHAITVYFKGDDFRPSFFGDADLRVLGSGFESRPAFVRWKGIRQGDTGYEAHYVITAPEGGWTEAHNGVVEVWLEPDQVARIRGFVPAQLVGTFQVCLGEMTQVESVELFLRSNEDSLVSCAGSQSSDSCHRQVTVGVVQDGNLEFYMPTLEHEERWDGAVQQEGNVWFLDLYQVPKRNFPYEPGWHPISNAFGGGFRRITRFTFEPPPGDYEFQIRSMGEIIAREAFAVTLNPKVRSESTQVIKAPGEVHPVVTVGYWHPEGVDIDSLSDDDLSADPSYTPGRAPPAKERVTFLDAEEDGEWVIARYRVSSPPGGWSALDNGDFVLSSIMRDVRTLTGSRFAAAGYKNVEGFEVDITAPFAGPIRVWASSSAPSVVGGALEMTVIVNFKSSEDVLDLASIDASDLVVMEGASVGLESVEVSEEVRVAKARYWVRLPSEIGFDERVVVELANDAVSTVSGQSTIGVPLLDFLAEPPHLWELTVSPVAIRKASHLPFRFTVRYPKSRLPEDPFVPPSVDVVASWLRESEWVGPHPPIPFRQTARIVNTFVSNGRGLHTVEYEIPAPEIGWTHVLNGPLALEIEGFYKKSSVTVAVPKPRVEASLDLTEAFPGIIGKVRVKTFNDLSVMGVTDWRINREDGGPVYLDATVTSWDIPLPGPVPEFFEQEHTFTIMDLQPPLAVSRFEEIDVVLRVNGERLAHETILPMVSPHEAVSPQAVDMIVTDHWVQVSMVFDSPVSSFVVLNDGKLVVIDEENFQIEGAVFMADPDRVSDGEPMRFSHRYEFESPRESSYRVELAVNGAALAEAFYFGGSTSFDSWRRLVVREAGGLSRLIVNGQRRKLGDLDGDGVSDFEEYAFASDMLDPRVRPKQGTAIEEGTGRLGILFQWPWDREDLMFTLETSEDLLEWETHRQLTRSRWKHSVVHRAFLDEGATAPFMRVRAEIGQ